MRKHPTGSDQRTCDGGAEWLPVSYQKRRICESASATTVGPAYCVGVSDPHATSPPDAVTGSTTDDGQERWPGTFARRGGSFVSTIRAGAPIVSSGSWSPAAIQATQWTTSIETHLTTAGRICDQRPTDRTARIAWRTEAARCQRGSISTTVGSARSSGATARTAALAITTPQPKRPLLTSGQPKPSAVRGSARSRWSRWPTGVAPPGSDAARPQCRCGRVR